MIVRMAKKLTEVTVRVVLASLLTMAALPTLAQIGKEPVEPAPESASWMAFLLAIFFAIAVAIGCLMSPKRTHQD
jgi:hypothetical protein